MAKTLSEALDNLRRAVRRFVLLAVGADKEIREAFKEGYKMGQEYEGVRCYWDEHGVAELEITWIWRGGEREAWANSDIEEVVNGR